MGLDPWDREKLVDTGAGVLHDTAQHVGEVGQRVDVQFPATRGERIEDRGGLAATGTRSDEQPVFATHCDGPQRVLGRVVVDPEMAGGGVHVQGVPLVAQIGEGLPERSLRERGQTISSSEEAGATVDARGLVQKPGSSSAKWVSTDKPQGSLQKRGHEKTVTMEVEPGTKKWLEDQAVDWMDVPGESSLPKGVLKKSNEPGALGIGNDLLKDFNKRVKKVKVK